MIVDIKLKGVWLKADIEGLSVGAANLDDVLAAGGALTADRTADLAGKKLSFENGNNHLTINPGTSFAAKVFDPTGGSNYSEVTASVNTTTAGFDLTANFNDGTKVAIIDGFVDELNCSITHTADTHNFIGKINNNTLQEFADDAAAVTGGLLPGDFYYTSDAGSGILKVVLPGI